MSRDETIRGTLARLRQELLKLYGEGLRGVHLFCSYARGEEDEESDIDVLIGHEARRKTTQRYE